jgi:hypothetical protein
VRLRASSVIARSHATKQSSNCAQRQRKEQARRIASPLPARSGALNRFLVIARSGAPNRFFRHCDELCDEAIQQLRAKAAQGAGTPNRFLSYPQGAAPNRFFVIARSHATKQSSNYAQRQHKEQARWIAPSLPTRSKYAGLLRWRSQ